jgi:hypothetical protein
MPFVHAYPRKTQEMVFGTHDRVFAFFRGACTREIFDNMRTAVEAILVGQERTCNRRFLRMCSHDLTDQAVGIGLDQVEHRRPGDLHQLRISRHAPA